MFKPHIYYSKETNEYCIRKFSIFDGWQYLDIQPIMRTEYKDRVSYSVAKPVVDHEYGYDSYYSITWWNDIAHASKYCFTKDPNDPIMNFKLKVINRTYKKVPNV